MLGLRQQIGSDPARIAVRRQDDRLRRAGRQIDRAIAADQLFGGGNVLIARAEDFLHAGNRLCAISESGNRLRPANARDFLDSEKSRRCQELGIWFGANGDDARNAGDFGGDRSHDQR